MPSLMPGMPGTKEAYGISTITQDSLVTIPPKAFEHYAYTPHTPVLLTTTHRGEGGFALIQHTKAETTVFAKFVHQIRERQVVQWFNEKAYVLTDANDGVVRLLPDMLEAFHLALGEQLLVIKCTTVAMSYTPLDIWKAKFAKRGLSEAISNMDTLERF